VHREAVILRERLPVRPREIEDVHLGTDLHAMLLHRYRKTCPSHDVEDMKL
jgi:hypothetical protein